MGATDCAALDPLTKRFNVAPAFAPMSESTPRKQEGETDL